jgi:hypothetical protein
MLYCKTCATKHKWLWLGNTRTCTCAGCHTEQVCSDAPLAAIMQPGSTHPYDSAACLFDPLEQTRIINTLANDEYSSDAELFDLLKEGMSDDAQQMLQRLIEQERPKFFTEVFHDIDWNNYAAQ